jgi:hypothetical protein
VFEDFDTNGDGRIDVVDFVDLSSLNPSAPMLGFAWWKAFKADLQMTHPHKESFDLADFMQAFKEQLITNQLNSK